jgi:hypothetical protein
LEKKETVMRKYFEARQSEILQRYGVFFAFSNKQLEEQKQPGVEYCSVFGAGDCVPKHHAGNFVADFQAAMQAGREQAIDEMGIEGIIRYELNNHEATYTGSIDDALDALEGYNITREQVLAVFRQMCREDD